MKKTVLLLAVFLFTASSYAQQAKPPAKPEKIVSPEIMDLTAQRDTAKSVFKRKTQENTKDINHFKKLSNSKETLKEQLKSAKKAKKSDKEETIQDKLTATTDSLVELNTKIKAGDKELGQLEKDLSNAEKALQKEKDRETKEKSKGKK